ncbi:hypothetical protein STEG23_005808 [Scotinomys teguina]
MVGMMVLQAEEGRNEKESGQCEPGWRTAVAEGEREKELSGESHTAACAVGLVDDNMNKEDGGAGGYQESEQQPKEPIPGGVEGVKALMVLTDGEGRNGEASGQGLVDEGNQEYASGSDQENENQPKKSVRDGERVAEGVQPVSVLVCQRCFHYKFSQWQLQELERFF